jgi:hypothetical protein
MSTVRIPLWVNLLSVVAGVYLVYLLARWEVWKTNRAKSEKKVIPLKGEIPSEGTPLKKAA